MTVIERMNHMTVEEIAKEMGFNLPYIDADEIDMIANEIWWYSDANPCEVCPIIKTDSQSHCDDYNCEDAIKVWLMSKFLDEQSKLKN